MKSTKTRLDHLLWGMVFRCKGHGRGSILGIVGGILLFTAGCNLDPTSGTPAGDPVGQCLLALQTFASDFSRQILAALLF